jgi:hypothetical protein
MVHPADKYLQYFSREDAKKKKGEKTAASRDGNEV